MKKFLVIQTASIGDVILATAVTEKLHSYFPDSQIDMMIKKGYESLFEDHPYLNKVYSWDKKKHKYGGLFSILKEVRRQRYDLIVDIQRYAATGFLTVFGKAKETAGFDKNPFSCFFTHKVKHEIGVKGLHEVDRNQKLIEHLTDNKSVRPALYPGEKLFEKMKHYKDEPYICVAPCSLWFTKQYPEDLILLVCDGAAWHRSKSLVCPSNIRLLTIPPYTPEMNPIEQIWKQLRSMGFKNEVFHSLADVVDRLCETICRLSGETVQSITARKWILECF